MANSEPFVEIKASRSGGKTRTIYADGNPYFQCNPFIAPTKPETKVVFSPPATILYVNGKKYVSKVHGEAYDEEKGLLMCISKAYGISHLELKRLIKNAKRYGDSYPEPEDK